MTPSLTLPRASARDRFVAPLGLPQRGKPLLRAAFAPRRSSYRACETGELRLTDPFAARSSICMSHAIRLSPRK